MKKMILGLMLFLILGIFSGCANTQKEVEDDLSAKIGKVSDYNAEEDEEDTENGEKRYDLEVYGTIEESQNEVLGEESGELAFYYEMGKFFVNDSFINAASVNSALQQIYDEYEAVYIKDAESYRSGYDEFDPPYHGVPYDLLHILTITYAGDDYISILYNDVCYMGGAHPYSKFDGITIDCKTGKQVSASQFLEKSDEEILTQVSNTMGLDVIGTWDDIDFYLTDYAVVFFYRVPNVWEDVILQRRV